MRVHEASRVPLKRVSVEVILASYKSIKGKHRGAVKLVIDLIA